MDEAINLYKEMHQKNVAPDIVTYTSLIDGLCKSGRIFMFLILSMICMIVQMLSPTVP